MKFTKMHGIGNDYVYVDCFSQKPPADPAALSAVISRPHTGVGSDGLILIEPCEGADARMRIFNKDGSEGEMCGNGIRCVGKYLYDSGIAQKPVIRVMTRGGMKLLEMLTDGEKALGARVDMGEMRFDPKDIPVNAESNEVHIEAEGVRAMFYCLNPGNPHAVTADIFPEGARFERLGSAFERHSVFPKRANISFIRVEAPDLIRARIWERGSGATLACGSGATACLVAAYRMGLCGSRARVILPGGELRIEYDETTRQAFMTGPAQTVFTGDWPDEA